MSDLNLSQLRHDLRTPINHIIGYSEMLREEAGDQACPEISSELHSIGAAGRQLLSLVSQGLESVNAEKAPARLARLHRQVSPLVEQIIGSVDHLRQSHKGPGRPTLAQDLLKIQSAAAGLLEATGRVWPPGAADGIPSDASGDGYGGETGEAPPSPAGWVNSGSALVGDPPAASPASENKSGCHLLVADDDAATRDMLCRRLERDGHRVTQAENGRRALELVQGGCFDLILLDLMMPDIDGYQVLTELKSHDSLRHIPVILLSALEEVDNTVRCIEMGAEDYLTKPFNPVLLRARIGACLEKKLLRDQEVRHLQEIESINAQLEKRVEERVKELRKSNQRLVLEVSQRRRLEQQLQSQMAEMALVDEVARIITSTLDIDETYQQFAQEMHKLLQFDRISISVIDHESDTYCLKYVFGDVMAGSRVGEIVPLRGSQTGHLRQTRRTLLRKDVLLDPAFNIDRAMLDAGLRSSIITPLISKGRVIATISLRGRQVGLYGRREQIIIERLARQIAPALENARLYQETSREKERATTTLAQLRALLEGVDAGIMMLGQDDETVLWANRRFAEFFGISDAESLVVGSSSRSLRRICQSRLKDGGQAMARANQITADRHYTGTEELELVYPESRCIQRFTTPIYDEAQEYLGRLWVYYDVTQRRKLEEQLVQSQKMESIGRLAGGIAHDFNNLLTPIMGYANLGSIYLNPEHPTQAYLQEVKKAADRASGLTNQLLAFARGQVIEPRVVDLNRLVLDTDELLRRLIGEDVELVTLPAPDLARVKVDPGQIEQVLLNLVINARDAMPQGGKLIVATANASHEPHNLQQRPDAPPGDYVVLSVTDTGVGMSEAVKAHLFEPFFTTKEQGKGTGLGLATCYGIIKQSGGSIEVESEVGQGSAFRIYLPITHETSRPLPPPVEEQRLPSGTETVLLAEDEPSVRGMVATILQNQGYTVLQAANGDEALKVAGKSAPGEIHLLLTDVVMPQMGGVELAHRFADRYPNTKVIFTSGYSDQPLVAENQPDGPVAFIQKPFMPAALAGKVREVLDQV